MNTKPIPIQLDEIQFPTEQALIDAQKLTLSNIQFIKNLIIQCMDELVQLDSNNMETNEYMRKVSYIRGEIAAYSFILSCHEAAHTNPEQQS